MYTPEKYKWIFFRLREHQMFTSLFVTDMWSREKKRCEKDRRFILSKNIEIPSINQKSIGD